MQSIWVGIRPERESTRILVMSGTAETLLKARLLPSPSSRLALSAFLEAIALWQGRPLRAALVADAPGGLCENGLCRDSFPDFGNGIHYTLEYVSVLRPPRRRDGLSGMGDFRDLRQLLLFDLSR